MDLGVGCKDLLKVYVDGVKVGGNFKGGLRKVH